MTCRNWLRCFCGLLNVIFHEAHIFGCLATQERCVPSTLDYVDRFLDALLVSTDGGVETTN